MRFIAGALLLFLTTMVAAGEERAPERLRDTGLYGHDGAVAGNVQPFSPQYPLWTDGAAKRRWVYLPAGTAIDATDPLAWEFPIGSKFWKEFELNGRKIETRMIWRASRDRWVFATYLWNDAGTDATLAPADGVVGAAPLAPGRSHTVPSVSDCGACHGTDRPAPLGFNALQLSPDRDPNAIHGQPLAPEMVTLTRLVEERRLLNVPPNLAEKPRIRTSDPATRSVLGYLVANCGSCHNGRGEIAAMGPTLKMQELLADGDAVARAFAAQRTRWQVPGTREGETVVLDPHAVERSALLVRMRSRSPSSQMPPLGTVLRDQLAVDRITEWARLQQAGSTR